LKPSDGFFFLQPVFLTIMSISTASWPDLIDQAGKHSDHGH